MTSGHSSRLDAKRIICAIIQEAGDRLESKTALFKAFYYAHLHYYHDNVGVLTPHPIVRMPNGPGIDDHHQLIAELQEEGFLTLTRERRGPFDVDVYNLQRSVEVSAEEKQAIAAALSEVVGRHASKISEESHDHSRSWRAAKVGEELDIYLDIPSDEDVKRLRDSVDRAGKIVDEHFR